jgi:1,4-alpha-glucan branching enzyme
MSVTFSSTLIDQIIKGRCPDFAEIMGMRRIGPAELQVNVFLPGVQAVEVLSSNGKRVLGSLQCIHAEGLFSATLAGKKLQDYRLRLSYGDTTLVQDDPYRHRAWLDSAELQLFSEGRHEQAWHLLGAHPRTLGDSEGVHFVLWAPLAQRVSVLLQQSQWDGRVHVMYRHAAHGLWELFIPGLAADAHYKFEVMDMQRRTTVVCYDPCASEVEPSPAFSARVTAREQFAWQDHFWQLQHSNQSNQALPLILHELSVTAGLLAPGIHWQQLASVLLPQIKQHGFTHVLLRDAGAAVVRGQQMQAALLAATPALGRCAQLQAFVDQAHALELAVVWDLSLTSLLHAHGLAAQSPLQLDLATLGGPLISIVLGCIDYWHRHLHIDGFRLRELDLLLTMPVIGSSAMRTRQSVSNDNPFAREWLTQLLARVRDQFPSLLLVAETAVSWPELTLPPSRGGLGFDYRLAQPVTVGPVLTGQVATNQVTVSQALASQASAIQAFATQAPTTAQALGFWLQQCLQHCQDGNRLQSLLSLIPSVGLDAELQELMMVALWTLPGRKHSRLDCQWIVGANWQPESGHDWELQFAKALTAHQQELLKELNLLYLSNPCLYELDTSHEGINVLHCTATAVAYERLSQHGGDSMLVMINVADQVSAAFHLGAVHAARYRLCCRAGLSESVLPVQLSAYGAENTGVNTLTLQFPARTAVMYWAEL